MSRTFQFILIIVTIAFTSLVACSKKDKVIDVADDDPEMLAAIAKARNTLPEFWQIFSKPEYGESDFSLKVKITDKHGTEFFWVVDIKRGDDKIMGTINNDPDIVSAVKLGERIQIPEADISDWLYLRDKKMVGNETIRPLFKKMPAVEVEQYKAMMATP